MKKPKLFLVFLIIIFLSINYSAIDSYLIEIFSDYEIGIVERVVDGDTIVVNATPIRLLGINSPEKKENGYLEAKEFLEKNILGEEIKIVYSSEKFDKYGRKLGYIFFEDVNINLESVRNGYSNIYFPFNKNEYYVEFLKGWEECLEKNINLCEKSKNKCIALEKLDLEKQEIVLKNKCNEKINLHGWSIKDEGRKKHIFSFKFLFPNESLILYPQDFGEEYIWTKSGDSIFIRDEFSKLVFYYHY